MTYKTEYKMPITLTLGILTSVSFGLVSLFAKTLSIDSQEIIFARSFLTFAISALFIVLVRKKSPFGKPENRVGLLFRGLVGYAAMSAYFLSLNHLTLGTATFIQFLSPLFTSILACYFLKENMNLKKILCITISLMGVAFISGVSPSGSIAGHTNLIHVGLSLLSALLGAVSYIMVKTMTDRGEEPEVIIFYFTGFSCLSSFFFSFQGLGKLFPLVHMKGMLFLTLLSLAACIGQFCLNYALKVGEASSVTATLYLTPLFATVFGLIFLRESLTLSFLIGGSLILLGQFFSSDAQAKAIPLEYSGENSKDLKDLRDLTFQDQDEEISEKCLDTVNGHK